MSRSTAGPNAASIWDRVHDRLPEILIAVAFVVSRAAFYIGGGRFKIDPQSQLASFHLLKTDLAQTIWYIHTQPPLFNLMVGMALKLPGVSLGWSFGTLYLILAAVLTAGIFLLAVELGASRWGAAIAAVAISCSPSVLLYQSWLTYDFVVAVGVVWTVLFFLRWAAYGTTGAFWGVCGCAGTLVLIRALFIPPWFVVVLAAAWWARRPSRRAIRGALVPLVLIGIFVVKDYVLFQQPGLSSWLGMNFSKVSIQGLPLQDRATLIRQRDLSPVTNVGPFAPYLRYAPYEAPCHVANADPPLLRQQFKPDGRVNLEYACYLPVYRQFDSSSLRAAVARPVQLAHSEAATYQLFVIPTWDYFPLRSSTNGAVIHPWTDIYEHSVTPVVSVPLVWSNDSAELFYALLADGPGNSRLYLDVLGTLSLWAAFGGAIVAAIRWFRSGRSPRRMTLVFTGFLTLYVTVVGNLFESGENMRFREGIEPLCIVVLAVGLDRGIRRLWRYPAQTGRLAMWRRPSSRSTTPVPNITPASASLG